MSEGIISHIVAHFRFLFYLQMVVKPKGAKCIMLPHVDIVMGKIPLNRMTKNKPPHARLNKLDAMIETTDKMEKSGTF